MTTAKLRKNDNKNMVEAMGIEYCEFDIVTNQEEHKEESVASLEERILSHCLVLPYVMPNENFEKKFALVYADWDVGSLHNLKQQMNPCATVLTNQTI